MGVPKFFRWISERYPCLSETVKEYQIPEFDNLYLDMNGIIHTCSHPDDADPHFRITEKKIFEDIFHYIEILFRMIQPQKLFFMAVDGVAPRAKMNQQRGRRFRSAKEAQVLERKAIERGETLPSEERFDSNCITPGTEFMVRLQEQLKYFVTYKISTDPSWQKCQIILSGHETPGEGEHKIMDYIRYMKSQPGYDPNTRHCLYGLDADLIMLGLCTHEPHFSLLREEVKFGRNQKRAATPEETKFFLLHLSLLRDYLELEFGEIKEKLSFPFDIEKIIDDWVLMGFLVGNDFIPHLPSMHINHGALATLYKAYMEALPALDGYINEAGTLNLKRFEQFLKHLSSLEMENFKETYDDLKYFEAKTGRKFFDEPDENCKDSKKHMDSELEDLIKATEDILVVEPDALSEASDTADDDDDSVASVEDKDEEMNEDLMYLEFVHYKERYYQNKLEYQNVNGDVLMDQAEGYVRAIQWNLNYYYNGICSWSWFYPHNYAPYISDIKDFSDMKLEFDLAKPFLPYEQLLAVLPSASKKLLPEAYQHLMVDPSSPIIDYYPTDFKTDLNGKQHEWEAVVLIPFIDEKKLLKAMDPCGKDLTLEEKRRNSHGPMLIYQFTDEDLGSYDAPEYFTPVPSNHAKVTLIWRDEINVDKNKLVKGLCPGVKLDVYFPGFPTLKHIKHTASFKVAGVKVFDHPSRGSNMILKIPEQSQNTVKEIAQELIGKTIFVSWPHLIEAKVVGVSTKDVRYSLPSDESSKGDSSGNGPDTPVEEEVQSEDRIKQWKMSKDAIKEGYLKQKGIDIGKTKILVHALNMLGRKYVYSTSGMFTVEKEWCHLPASYALQATVKDIAVHDPTFTQYKSLDEIFTSGSTCFMLGQPRYGAKGLVLKCLEDTGRVRVSLSSLHEPKLDTLKNQVDDFRQTYLSGSVASQHLGISPHLLSRVTGSIFVTRSGDKDSSRTNVGLNLKFNKKNEEVPGYTRKEGTMWLYSTKTIELIKNYMRHFPTLFDYLSQNAGNDVFQESQIFPDNPRMIHDITTWLKEQPFYKVERSKVGSSRLDPEFIEKLNEHIGKFMLEKVTVQNVAMQVKPHLLYKPGLHFGSAAPDPKADYRLMDRIVNVRENYTVPLGLRGTIIGIHENENEDDMYEVLFDKPFPGGLSLLSMANQVYRMHKSAIINISYGERSYSSKSALKSGGVDTANTKSRAAPLLPLPLPQQSPQPYNYNPRNNGQQYIPSATYTNQRVPSRQPSAFVSWGNNSYDVKPPPLLNSHPPFIQPLPPPYQANSMPFPTAQMDYMSGHQKPPGMYPAGYQRRDHNYQQRHYVPPPLQQFNAANRPSPAHKPPEYTILPRNQPLPHSVAQQTQETEYKEIWKSLQRAGTMKEAFSPTLNNTTAVNTRLTNTEEREVNFRKPLQHPQQTRSPHENVKKIQVDDLFKMAARTPELKKHSVTGSRQRQESYSMQLLTFCQQRGLGIPLYSYMTIPEYGKEMSTVKIQGIRSFEGDLTDTREEATESAASLALNFLKLQIGPNQPLLPDPPEKWYNSNMSAHGRGVNSGIFPQSANLGVGHNVPSSSITSNIKVQQQFIPLQAVKNQLKISDSRQSSSPAQQPKKTSKVQPQSDIVKPVVNIQVNVPSSVPNSPSTPKPIISKPKKSRIAANFGMNGANS